MAAGGGASGRLVLFANDSIQLSITTNPINSCSASPRATATAAFLLPARRLRSSGQQRRRLRVTAEATGKASRLSDLDVHSWANTLNISNRDSSRPGAGVGGGGAAVSLAKEIEPSLRMQTVSSLGGLIISL